MNNFISKQRFVIKDENVTPIFKARKRLIYVLDKIVIDLITASNSSTTGGTVWALPTDGLISDPLQLIQIPAGYPRITGGRWLDPGWSSVDADGVLLTNALSVADAGTNLCAHSRNFDASGTAWTDSGVITTTSDEVGIDGIANAATTVIDNTAGLYKQYVVSCPNDSNTNQVSIFVKKDSNIARFPIIGIRHINGTTVQSFATLNTVTGAISVYSGAAVAQIIDRGVFWQVILCLANNASGNTLLAIRYYPSGTSVFGAGSPLATGSSIIDQVDMILDSSIVVPSRITDGSTTSTDADINTVPTPLVLTPQSGAIEMVVDPAATGQAKILFGMFVDALNYTNISAAATKITFFKRIGAAFPSVVFDYVHLASTPLRIQIYWDSILGMGIRVADASANINLVSFVTAVDVNDAPFSNSMQIGHRDGALLFIGEYANNGLPIGYTSKEAAVW